jgi:ribosomal protein L33
MIFAGLILSKYCHRLNSETDVSDQRFCLIETKKKNLATCYVFTKNNTNGPEKEGLYSDGKYVQLSTPHQSDSTSNVA